MVKSLKANKPCDKNCFECPYPDCINDEMDLEDYRESKTIDFICGVKEYKQSDHRREYKRQWNQKNREKINAKAKERYQKKKEWYRAYNKAYRENHKDQMKLYDRKHKQEYRKKKKEERLNGN